MYRNSDVYLNGKLLGNHPYAYTGFSYDLTGLVHTDGVTEDVIAVSCADQQPSSRWYSGDGIFRNVYLVTTGPVHVARHGTFVTTPGLPGTLSSGYATVQVDTDVANDGLGAGTGAGGGHPDRPGREACGPGGGDGQRAGRADPDRDGQREGHEPAAVVHGPPAPLLRADQPVRGRRGRGQREHARSASGTSRSTRPPGSR